MRAAVAPGVSTADLDAIARDVLREAGATPSFLGYHGYPAVICASVNDRVVHGIPSAAEKLREGDLISIDFGAIVDGWHGDSAISVPVGEVAPERRRAVERLRERRCGTGWRRRAPAARLTDISHAVESSIRAAGQVRHRRRLRRARHRLRDAHGPAHPQLRPGRQGSAADARAWRWRSSRW